MGFSVGLRRAALTLGLLDLGHLFQPNSIFYGLRLNSCFSSNIKQANLSTSAQSNTALNSESVRLPYRRKRYLQSTIPRANSTIQKESTLVS